jgi:hypothetical protein
MKLKSPTQIVFWLSVLLAVLGLIGQFGVVAGLGGAIAFWLVLVAFVLLALGVLFKGL